MNLRWYDRILIALSGIVMLGLGVLTALMGGGVVRPEAFSLDYWLGDGWQWMPVIVLAGLLLVAWGVWLLTRPFFNKSAISGRYYTLKNQEAGEVHIAVQALDHLVHKALSVWPEILSAHVRIGGQEDAMHITLRASIAANVRIPELVAGVREEIKRYVEECAGVKVESVKVIIVSTKDVQQEEIKLLPSKAGPQGTVEPERVSKAGEAEPGASAGDAFEAKPEPVPLDESPKEVKSPWERHAANEEPAEPFPVTLSEDAFPFPHPEPEEEENEPGDTAGAAQPPGDDMPDGTETPPDTEEETPDE